MNAPSPGITTRIEPWRWQMVWLLFLATLINYMDRRTMNSTSTYIINEFGLGESGYSQVEFAFGISFAFFQIVAGFLVDRFSLRWLYFAALLTWSAAGLCTGLVSTFGLLVACRVLLGVGEAFNWPCAVSAVRRVMPPDSRPYANGLFHSGASVGAVLTPLLAYLIIDPQTGQGWRTLFIVVGAIGAIWLVLWLGLASGERGRLIDTPAREDPPTLATATPVNATATAAAADQSLVPFAQVFAMRTFWLAIAVGVSVNVCWHFCNTWFPRYLTRELSIAGGNWQLMIAGFFIAADLGSILAGWGTRRIIRAGYSIERARKLVLTLTAGLCLMLIPAVLTTVAWLAVLLFFVAAAGSMGGFANYFALSQDVVAHHTAKVLGLIGFTSWVIISLLALVAGSFFDAYQTFVPLFIVVAFVPLAGALLGWLWPERR